MVIPVSYAALREATREREAGVADQEDAGALGGGRRRPWRKGSWNYVWILPARGFI
jgi:hypothetical protein